MIEQPHTPSHNGALIPSKLTEKVCVQICKLLAQGVPMIHATRSAGVGDTTVRKWLQQGEIDIDEGLRTPHSEFYERVQKAKSDFVTSQALIVAKHAAGFRRKDGVYNEGDYRAAQWMLERRGGEEWLPRERVEMTHEGMISHKHELVIPDDSARLLEISSLLGEIGATAPAAIEGTTEEASEEEE